MKNLKVTKFFAVFMAIVLCTTFILPAKQAEASLGLSAESAILVDADTGKILYQKDIDKPLPIASMAKMMSQYLILEAIDEGRISWDQTVNISSDNRQLSLERNLSNVMLRQDYEYTVKDLYEAVTIYSANAATMALAELVAGTETEFVRMMNAKAEELGIDPNDFEFVNSTGLNNRDLRGNHPEGTGAEAESYMSARATAQLAYALLRDYPEILEVASIPRAEFQAGPDEVVNMPNWNFMLPGLVKEFDGIDGLKTGSTSSALGAFTGTAERNGMRLISVVMRVPAIGDEPYTVSRFTETANLMNFGFSNFKQVELFPSGYALEGEEIVEVAAGKEREVSITSSETLSTVVRNGQEESYGAVLELDSSKLDEGGRLVAPFEAGEAVGVLKAVHQDENDQFLFENQQDQVTVVTDQGVEKAGWFSMMMRGIGGFFSGIWTAVVDTVTGWFS